MNRPTNYYSLVTSSGEGGIKNSTAIKSITLKGGHLMKKIAKYENDLGNLLALKNVFNVSLAYIYSSQWDLCFSLP